MAARNRADRARGFRASSAAPGVTARRCSNSKLGGGVVIGAGSWRERRGAVALRFRKKSLTLRSSSE